MLIIFFLMIFACSRLFTLQGYPKQSLNYKVPIPIKSDFSKPSAPILLLYIF